jgi:uncharacterized protein YndB with AHSA1/START domain
MPTPNVPHRIEFELVVPAPPEAVWPAIATAEGITAWMTPTEMDAREGGAVAFHMGPDATSHGRVTRFEPPHRIAYEEYWDALMGRAGADVTPLLTEFLVEARAGGTSVVRVVTSAFGTGADWENEFFDEMSTGWGTILDNLRLYLEYFPGQRATTMWVGTTFGTTPESAIAVARDALGISRAGDRVECRGLDGRVERVHDRHFLVRIDRPVPGLLSFSSFGSEEGSGMHVQGFLFSADAAKWVARAQPDWQSWLEQLAASLTAGSAGRG